MFFFGSRASFGEYEKGIGVDIVTGVAKAATPRYLEMPHNGGFPPSGFARR
jgi:hypothetical protein